MEILEYFDDCVFWKIREFLFYLFQNIEILANIVVDIKKVLQYINI